MADIEDNLTYYELLEVKETSSQSEIKKAYHNLAKEYHPDRVPPHLTKLKKEAEEKFKQIKEAYEVLIDPIKRKEYDDLLKKLREEERSVNLCDICNANEALITCTLCGKEICHNCETTYEGKSYCPICYKEEAQPICEVCHNIPSILMCNSCGKNLCNNCKKDFKSTHYCPDCFSKELEKNCEICQKNPKISLCKICGKEICLNCESKIGGNSYCPDCFKERSKEKKEERTYLLISSIFSIILAVIFFSYWWNKLNLKLGEDTATLLVGGLIGTIIFGAALAMVDEGGWFLGLIVLACFIMFLIGIIRVISAILNSTPLFLNILAALLSILLSIIFFKSFKKIKAAIITPLILFSLFNGSIYLFHDFSKPSIAARKEKKETTTFSDRNISNRKVRGSKVVPHVKTEEEEFYEVINNPHLNRYLQFIQKYPKNEKKNELTIKVKLEDPNLPPEIFWENIKKNSKSYWETRHKNLIQLVWIPPGKVMIRNLGYVKNQQKREISVKGFWIGKHEVNVEQYKYYCIENNINLPDTSYRDKEPIRNISWHEADEFSKWFGCRLPTEIEWIRAAKGGANYNNYPWGEAFSSSFCNVNSNYISEIGNYRENGFGLHDIVGNVEEWCQNWYSKDIFVTPTNNLYKVLRGGSYQDMPSKVTMIRRNYMFPTYKKETYGFRVAMDK